MRHMSSRESTRGLSLGVRFLSIILRFSLAGFCLPSCTSRTTWTQVSDHVLPSCIRRTTWAWVSDHVFPSCIRRTTRARVSDHVLPSCIRRSTWARVSDHVVLGIRVRQLLFVCPLLCFLLLLLSVPLLTPEEGNFCRKRLCTIVSLCFVALVTTFPWICHVVFSKKGKRKKATDAL